MTELPSYVRDTKHVLQIIEDINEKIEKGEVSLDKVALITLDVEQMYNTMTEELAFKGSKEYLKKKEQEVRSGLIVDENNVTPESILAGLELCLKNNYFQFNNKVYQQVSGIGTGLKLAPPYACLGMGQYEKSAFRSNQPLLDLLLLWKRFIDDVFGLFYGSEEQFNQLSTWLNSLMPGVVKFTANFSFKEVEFLDLVIKIEDGKLKTNLFIKPSNLQLYLNYFSNHPEPCKTGLVYGQALRVLERCSDSEDAKLHLDNLKEKLCERNYPENMVVDQIEKASKRSRESLITQKRKKKTKDNKARLIFTHNEQNPPLHQWIRESRKLLTKNEKAKEIGQNIQIAFRQPKNIKKIAAGAQNGGRRETDPNAGCKKCDKNCHACKILIEGKEFKSKNTGKIYRIREKISCSSEFIVYLANCQKCGGQYVGKSSQQFKRRHSGHKQEIKNKIGGLGQHYGGNQGCGYESLRVIIIEKVETGNHEQLGRREIYWQNQLRCFTQNGGNAQCRRKEK